MREGVSSEFAALIEGEAAISDRLDDAGPPISICSTHSSSSAPEATVSENG